MDQGQSLVCIFPAGLSPAHESVPQHTQQEAFMNAVLIVVSLWIPVQTPVQTPLNAPSDQGQAADSQDSQAAPVPAELKLLDARNAVRDALRESSRNAGTDPKLSVPRLVDLHRQLEQSDQLPSAERKRLQGQLRTRLLQIEGMLVRQLSRADSKKPAASPANTPSAASQPTSLSGPRRTVLAQQLGNAQPGNGGAAGGMQNAPRDAGWDLVELIRATVAPETWDVNGGKGSMYYYSPLQVLVVRQTQEAHHQLGGVLGQLR